MSDYPPIAPVAADATRPFWSVMIPTYEPDPAFLRRAITSVLEQDPGPAAMEIAVVDDASARLDPRDCIPAAARDRVALVRQPTRVGIGRNWNAGIRLARGHWVHLLHQDDCVLPGFYAAMGAGIATCPQAGAVFCRDLVIDAEDRVLQPQRQLRREPGIIDDWIEHVFVRLHLRCPAIVVRRAVYEALGGFREDFDYALDWDMWKRIAVAFPLWYTPEALACYRRHDENTSLHFQRTGGNMKEIDRSIALSERFLEPLLPAAAAAETTRRARENYGLYATNLAWQAIERRDLRTALAQLRAARDMLSTRTVARELGRRARRAWRA
jgi:GT2 family glycosyltransferase